MKKYNDTMNALFVSPEVFLMLSNPSNFCSNSFMKWEKRREILFELAGGVSDDEIFESSPELRELKAALGKKSIDDMKAMLKSSLKNLNEQIEKIPVQISENERSIEDIGNHKLDDLQAAIKNLENSKKAIQTKLSIIENGGQAAISKKQILEIENEMQRIKNKFEQAKADAAVAAHKKFNEQTKSRTMKQTEIHEIEYTIQRLTKEISEKEADVQKLREAFAKENESTPCTKTNCPTCQQKLPEDMIELAIATANKNKSEVLQNINTRGKALALEIENGKKLILDYELALQGKSLELDVIVVDETIYIDNRTVNDLPEYRVLTLQRHALTESLNIPDETATVEVDALKAGAARADVEISNINSLVAKVETVAKANARIGELKQSNIILGDAYNKDSRLLYLIELFIRTKINQVTDKINSKFSLVKFRLFDELENGNLKECCEAMVNGVPYNTNLNTEGKTNAGLDCIKVLQGRYGINAPVTCDNRESVSDLLVDMPDTQIISLHVSPKYKKLTLNPETQELDETRRVIDHIYAQVQGMRESGDTDLRGVLHVISGAIKESNREVEG
jgi:chromosome segregation ATPase